jgi:hypothetical protein
MAFNLDISEIVEERGLRDGYNGTGTDIGTGLLVTGTAGAAYDSVQLAGQTAVDVVLGVTRDGGPAAPGGTPTPVGIKNGYRGSLGVKGIYAVKAGAAGYAKGQRLTCETGGTGCAVPWAPGSGVNQSLVGIAITTAAAGAYGLVEMAPPGSIAQGQ